MKDIIFHGASLQDLKNFPQEAWRRRTAKADIDLARKWYRELTGRNL
ncbi:MAG: hypothetical protein M0P70_05375 [Desulfobulbaceae bacterium]|nr:hypothetical protein [Desulfobulbaceae bacterium]